MCWQEVTCCPPHPPEDRCALSPCAPLPLQHVGTPLNGLDLLAASLTAFFILYEAAADQDQWEFQARRACLPCFFHSLLDCRSFQGRQMRTPSPPAAHRALRSCTLAPAARQARQAGGRQAHDGGGGARLLHLWPLQVQPPVSGPGAWGGAAWPVGRAAACRILHAACFLLALSACMAPRPAPLQPQLLGGAVHLVERVPFRSRRLGCAHVAVAHCQGAGGGGDFMPCSALGQPRASSRLLGPCPLPLSCRPLAQLDGGGPHLPHPPLPGLHLAHRAHLDREVPAVSVPAAVQASSRMQRRRPPSAALLLLLLL